MEFGINKEKEKTKLLKNTIENYDNVLEILNKCKDIETAKKYIKGIKELLEFCLARRPC